MDQDTHQHIREKIIDYLSRQGFSEKKLLKKVTDLRIRYPHSNRYAGYISSNVLQVIEELKQEGIINDEQYARDVLRQLKDKKDGPERIRQKLFRRLIPKNIIQLVMQEFSQNKYSQDYSKIIRDVQRKQKELLLKSGKSKTTAYIIKQKIFAYLAQKGYYPDAIRSIIEQARIK